MTARRISLVGCSGVGKSTLARRVAARCGLPHLELDGLFHQPGWTPLETEEFQGRVDAFMDRHDSWIIDGNYSRVRDRVWQRATLVAWLDLSRARTMRQVISRTWRRARDREELWNGNRERWQDVLSLDPKRSILMWAWTQHRSRPVSPWHTTLERSQG